MIQLKDCQELAVNKLINKYYERRNNPENSIINFQAPTGSGKTLILCDLCGRIFHAFKKCIILFISISTGDIQIQNYNKANKYKAENCYIYETHLIPSPSNTNKGKNDYLDYIPLKNHYVYFMGSSTYTKNAKIRKEQYFDTFLYDAKKQGYEIVYIRDEAHIGTDNNVENLDNLLTKPNTSNGITFANGTIYVSATLEQKRHIDVEITYEEAIEDGLIKGNPVLFEGLSNRKQIKDAELLEHSLEVFTKKIQKGYAKLPSLINPCLLIQISNTKKQNKKEEETIINSYIKQFEKYNLNWLVYLDNDVRSNISYFKNKNHLSSFDKELITANDSDVDVVMFKVALATGWDIPRANMLLQLRDIYSETLDIQTIGRIRRNPLARKLNLDSPEKILNDYYIYSNAPKINKNECQSLKQNNELQIIWKLEQLNEDFQTVLIDKKSLLNNNETSKQYLTDFFNGLIKKFNERIYTKGTDTNRTWHQDILDINSMINEKNAYPIQLSLLYLDEEHKNSIPLVSEDITNVFQVEKYWNEKIKSYNNEKFSFVLNEFIIYYANKYEINSNSIKLFFCDSQYKDAFDFFRKEFNLLNKDSEFTYKLSEKFTLPKKTLEYLNSTKKSNTIKLNDKNKKYLYWIPDEENNENQSNKKINNYVYNDSNGETEFIDRMLALFDKKFGNESPHIYFFKNYINNSNFRYEYIDEQPLKTKRSHYPDFIIERNNEIYVCELKSLINDYDSVKTEELEKAYKEYSLKSKYHYVIVKWDESNKSFTWNHWLHGSLLNSYTNEKDLSKIFI